MAYVCAPLSVSWSHGCAVCAVVWTGCPSPRKWWLAASKSTSHQKVHSYSYIASYALQILDLSWVFEFSLFLRRFGHYASPWVNLFLQLVLYSACLGFFASQFYLMQWRLAWCKNWISYVMSCTWNSLWWRKGRPRFVLGRLFAPFRKRVCEREAFSPKILCYREGEPYRLFSRKHSSAFSWLETIALSF